MSKSSDKFLGRRELYAALVLALPVSAFAAVTPAAGGPGVTAGNTPVVNIVAPNGAGVSHNRFDAFSVDSHGVVLNNSAKDVTSQLAGQLTGNANLAHGEARVIITEVTGKTSSALNGALEIAGRKAALVVANPNGISADGASFINASRVTLTTGTPQFDRHGRLDAIDVRQGAISVTGNGLDMGGAERAELLARSVDLNAKLQAGQLRVVTGASRVEYAGNLAFEQEGTGAAPAVALDVGQLGSMYADSIVMLGTERGVGVNVAGTIQARTGALSLDTAGGISVAKTGELKAQTNLGLVSRQTSSDASVKIAGNAQAGDSLSIFGPGAVDVAETGTLKTEGQLLVNAGTSGARGLSVAGKLEAGAVLVQSPGDVAITKTGTLKARYIDLYGGGAGAAGAGTNGVSIAGGVEADYLSVFAAGRLDIADSGTLDAHESMKLTAGLDSWGYAQPGPIGLNVAGKVKADSLALNSVGGLNVAESGVLTAKSGMDLRTGSRYGRPNRSGVDVAGKVESENGSLHVDAAGAVSVAESGSLKAQSDLSLLASDVSNAGTLASTKGNVVISSRGGWSPLPTRFATTGTVSAGQGAYVYGFDDKEVKGTISTGAGDFLQDEYGHQLNSGSEDHTGSQMKAAWANWARWMW